MAEETHPFRGAIFDLDGVITKTAALHSRAWKQMFDAFLQHYQSKTGVPQQAFTHQDDYLPYVDGKPRYEGVASFLESRNIHLPYGRPSDPPGDESVCALGNRKNDIFNGMVREGLVEVYSSTVRLIEELQAHGVRIGVASSSKNTRAVLEGVKLLEVFEARVDGVISAELGLKGKPAPDIFLEAAARMHVSPYECIVVEDAIAGVSAASAGGFGLVLGVAREENHRDLLAHGADLVVDDVEQISLEDLEQWFVEGLPEAQWVLRYVGYEPGQEGVREALTTIGNGYIGTRGALAETAIDSIHYPGTYVAGVYNALESDVQGRTVRNEDMVNLPNWLPVRVRIDDGAWLHPVQTEVLKMERQLDLRTGELQRITLLQDSEGRITKIDARRFVSMAQPHLAGQRWEVTPVNYSATLTLEAALDGRVHNWGVPRYRQLSSHHLEPIQQDAHGHNLHLEMQTTQSKIRVAMSAHVEFGPANIAEGMALDPAVEEGRTALRASADLEAGTTIAMEKMTVLYTSRETSDPEKAAEDAIQQKEPYQVWLEESIAAWEQVWRSLDVKVVGDRLSQMLLRLGLYHTILACSPHHTSLDAGIPARGLTGEAYRGHIFWDELFILPVQMMHFPEAARSVLQYRYRRLPAAKENARNHGYQGAMYPWQSGSDGSEETQELHLNPLSGEWGPDYSPLQRHVALAVAYNVWQYVHITGDDGFMQDYGAEILFEVCRLWASLTTPEQDGGRISIDGVMGPDEYHEAYPGAPEGGLRNNSYSNIMAMWLFKRAAEVFEQLTGEARDRLLTGMALTEQEVQHWEDLRRRLTIRIVDDGVLEQFEGYHTLPELDWEGLRAKYDNVKRMDRILKAEGESADSYQVSKQADALMAFYLLGEPEIRELLEDAGYSTEPGLLERTFDYYLPRTSHGSTLSPLVHADLASRLGREALSAEFFREALVSDYRDVQGKTTPEGVHVGVMAGCALLCMRTYGGLSLDDEVLHFDPKLPGSWSALAYRFGFKGEGYSCLIEHDRMRIKAVSTQREAQKIIVKGKAYTLEPDVWLSMPLQGGTD